MQLHTTEDSGPSRRESTRARRSTPRIKQQSEAGDKRPQTKMNSGTSLGQNEPKKRQYL